MLFSYDKDVLPAALRAREIAKGEKHKEAAKERREANLSYDDLDQEDSKQFSDYAGMLKLLGWCAVVAVGLVTMFFLIF